MLLAASSAGPGFNPRPRAGGDIGNTCSPLPIFWVSIHAPARGATLVARDEFHRQQVSIHAPARGATQKEKRARRLLDVSIHAPARGATLRVLW